MLKFKSFQFFSLCLFAAGLLASCDFNPLAKKAENSEVDSLYADRKANESNQDYSARLASIGEELLHDSKNLVLANEKFAM